MRVFLLTIVVCLSLSATQAAYAGMLSGNDLGSGNAQIREIGSESSRWQLFAVLGIHRLRHGCV